MHKVIFGPSIKTINDLYSAVKHEYMEANIPVPFPAANRLLQVRMEQFVAKEKLIVLSVDDEIKMIVSSFIEVFKKTGYIESAAKCHTRLSNSYAVSDKRIRMVQRIIAKFIVPSSRNNENENLEISGIENEGFKAKNGGNEADGSKEIHEMKNDKENAGKTGEIKDNRNDNQHKEKKDDYQCRNVLKGTQIYNYDNALASLSTTTSQRTVITRSLSKLNQTKNIGVDNRKHINEPSQTKKS
ncbi:unnamed protein product [Adineta steineri]|uniref:Uncharacterized protein n=1 Tax=Adineta steineri TaxID=433720 RepID=A0A819RQH8_9BILA|nr:unnamed protein product [Adineta steineri]CAF4056590.1 unnamed protein product [Adineta steineri]